MPLSIAERLKKPIEELEKKVTEIEKDFGPI